MRSITLFLSLSLLSLGLQAQSIWPGDVNNNGTVNGVDLLYWGIANGSSGPARASVETDWLAQNAPADWSQSFPGGLNYAYADCNGDGLVDSDDFDEAIDDNFSQTHGILQPDGYNNAASGSIAPQLRLVPSMEIVGEGAMVTIDLFLDDERQAIPDFYGLALQLSYTTDLLEGDDGPDFDFTEGGWIAAADNAAQELFIDDDGSGQAQLAVSRTNQIAVNVEAAAIGQFSIVIEDIIVGLSVDTFELIIDSVFLINDQLQSVAAITDTARIIIAKDPAVLLSSSTDGPAEVQKENTLLYPNPTKGSFFLETELEILDLRLVDQWGRQQSLRFHRQSQGRYQLEPPPLLPAIYYLQIHSNQGIICRKIMFAP